MNVTLLIHYGIGILVVLIGVLLSWRRSGRRIMLYLLTLQIVLGVGIVLMGLRAPMWHYALAILAWVGYMVANGIEKRRGTKPALVASVLSTIVLLATFYIGMHAVKMGA